MRREGNSSVVIVRGQVTIEEPTIITEKYGKGGFYITRRYIPSSTISGVIISKILGEQGENKLLNRSEIEERFKDKTIWISHAYPKLEIETNMLPLSLTTIAKQDNTYVSTAISWANLLMRRDRDLLRKLCSLNYKVPRAYYYYNPEAGRIDSAPSPKTETYTHVSLSYETRSAFQVAYTTESGEKEISGLMYTVEYMVPPETFAFKAYLSEDIYAMLTETGGEIRVRIGMGKSKGYGLSTIKIGTDKQRLEDYIEARLNEVEKLAEENGWIVPVEALTHTLTPPNIGKIIYRRVRVENLKTIVSGEPIIYRNAMAPGSVWVLKIESDEMEKVMMLEKPEKVGTSKIAVLHGMNMFQVFNPVHNVKVS